MNPKIVLKYNIDLLLIAEEGKRHYVLFKDFSIFLSNHKYWKETFLSLIFYRRNIKTSHQKVFKIHGKQIVKMPEKDEYGRLKNYERKKKIVIHFLYRF